MCVREREIERERKRECVAGDIRPEYMHEALLYKDIYVYVYIHIYMYTNSYNT